MWNKSVWRDKKLKRPTQKIKMLHIKRGRYLVPKFEYFCFSFLMLLDSLSTWSRTSTAVVLWNGYNFSLWIGSADLFCCCFLFLPNVSVKRAADIVWRRMNDRSLTFLGRITLYLFKYLCPRGSWWAVPDCCSALQLLHNLHLNKKEFKREYFILGNEWSIQAWYKFVFNVKLIIISYLSRPFLFFRISVGHSWGSHSGATFPPCFFRCAVVQTGEGNENTDLSWQMFQVIVSLQSFLHDE